MITKEQVRANLTGPQMSLRTPFTESGSIDEDALKKMIDFAIDHGCKTSLLTAGDSHFACMSDEEIKKINKLVADHTAGRAMVVGADWCFGQPQAIDFAKYCRDIGVDILMTRPAEWAKSIDGDMLVDYYREIAEIIPVMIVTNIFVDRSLQWTLDVLEKSLHIKNIMALKEDLGNEVARQICLLCHKHWAIFAGGGLRNHLNMHPFGCDGFMDRHMNFKPEISWNYWKALNHQNFNETSRIIREIELPIEKVCAKVSGGRDAAVHGIQEIIGLGQRWRRKPYYSVNDRELDEIKQSLKELKIL